MKVCKRMTLQKKFGITLFRSNWAEVFCKKGVLKNLAKFTGQQLCRSIFLIKLHAWIFIEKDTLG